MSYMDPMGSSCPFQNILIFEAACAVTWSLAVGYVSWRWLLVPIPLNVFSLIGGLLKTNNQSFMLVSRRFKKEQQINNKFQFTACWIQFNEKTLVQLFVEGSSFCRFGLRHVALHRYTKGPILEHNHIHTTNVKDRHGCLYQHVDPSTKFATGIM